MQRLLRPFAAFLNSIALSTVVGAAHAQPVPAQDEAPPPHLEAPPPPPPGMAPQCVTPPCGQAGPQGAWVPPTWPTVPPPVPYQLPPQNPESLPGRWTRRPIAVEGVLALTSPVGMLGVAVDWALDPHFVLNAGLGAGGSGLQVAVTPRLRIPAGDVVGFGVEAGLSAGPYEELCFMCEGESRPKWDVAIWANTGLVMDLRTGAGFHFRLFGGQEFMLNEGSCNKESVSARCADNVTIPYFGVAFGGAPSVL